MARFSDSAEKWNRIKRSLRSARRATGTVGVHKTAGKHPKSNLTIAEVAIIQEFGLGNSPERPFLSFTVDTSHGVYFDAVADVYGTALGDGRRFGETAIAAGGFALEKVIKRNIELWATPPNAPSTIRKKGFNNPLIETRALVNSVSTEVK